MENCPQCIEVETGAAPSCSVIWLHGLGADGSDFVPIVSELGLPPALAVRFVFPHAPYRRVTCNGGYEMRAWYDILSLEPHSRRIDEAGLLESCASVRALIEREKGRGVAVDRIFIAGFSQGGAVAYTSALTYPERLAGVLALSTYIPAPDYLRQARHVANDCLPVLAAHGVEDTVVSPQLGMAARDLLLEFGHDIEWREFPIEHSVSLEEVRWIGRWLAARMC